MTPWRRRKGEPDQPPEEIISPEDIAWRIGASSERPNHPRPPEPELIGAPDQDSGSLWGAALSAPAEAGPGPDGDAPPDGEAPGRRPAATRADRPPHVQAVHATSVQHAHPVAGGSRRAGLWRDVSTLLFGAVVIVLIVQLAIGRNGLSGEPSPSADGSAHASDVAVLATDGRSPSTNSTIGPVLDPSLIPVLEATPTPIPIITLPPATSTPHYPWRPVPTPSATPRPSVTPRPTFGPTPPPSATPSPTPTPTPFIWYPPPPTPTPSPTPTPPPTASFTWACNATQFSVDFDASGSSASPGTAIVSYSWDFVGSGVLATNIFAGAGPYSVTLTVTADDSQTATATDVNVGCP